MNTETINQSTQPAVLINPFPGLRPFEFDESHLFFGRDGQSERLIAKLAATRFLAVVGTSGSGKSSLVRAGLLPALYSGFMPSAGSAWRIAIVRPGNDPLGNLARALNHPDVFGSDDEANRALQVAITEATLRRGSLGLVEAAREQQLPASENLLVVADQFEELFRVDQGTKDAEHENDRAAFVKLLLAATAKPQGQDAPREVNIYVVLTMRSDYLGDCAQFWDLPEAINEGQYLIPRLTREQIREAITGPIFVGGAEATPRLINRLLNDVGDNPDQLPILQHALMRVWDERREQRLKVNVDGQEHWHRDVHQGAALDLCCYEAVGTMSMALSLHADEAFNELPDDRHLIVAERVFKALTEKGPDNREIRRPVELRKLRRIANASEAEVKQVIETFRAPGRSFLMPPIGTELTAESLIDISHESLMRNWGRLKDWVEDEARSGRIYKRLAETTELSLKNEATLLRDPELQVALDWRIAARPNPHWAERYGKGYKAAIAFLKMSAAQRNADLKAAERLQSEEAERAKRELAQAQALAKAQRQNAEAERLRAEEQAQAADKLRQRARVLAFVLVVAVSLAFLAVWAFFRAKQHASQALSSEQKAKESESISRQFHYLAYMNLAAEAYERGSMMRVHHLLNAFLPLQEHKSDYDPREFSWYYLWHMIHKEQATLKGHTGGVNSVAVTADGKLLATGSSDQTIRLWDVEIRKEVFLLKGHQDDVTAVSFSSDGKLLASASQDKTVKLWDVQSGRLLQTLLHNRPVDSAGLAPDGKRLASGDVNGVIRIWDTSTGQLLSTISGHQKLIRSLTFSPNSQTLVSASDDTTLKLWELKTGHLLVLLKHLAELRTVAFSADGQKLASGAKDGKVKLWNVRNGKLLRTLEHAKEVRSVSFSQDGKFLASGSWDGTIKLWDAASGNDLGKLVGHEAGINALVFIPGKALLASGDWNGATELWDLSIQQANSPKLHAGGVWSVSYAPDGKTLVSASDDWTVKLWDVESGQLIQTFLHPDLVRSVAFAPDGQAIATACRDNQIRIWELKVESKVLGLVNAFTLSRNTKLLLPKQLLNCVAYTLAFAPDGKLLASGGDDKLIKLWEVASGRLILTLNPNSGIRTVAFSPDGSVLSSGGDDNTVRLWAVKNGDLLATLTGHENVVWATSFSPDGRYLASGSGDYKVKLWDIETARDVKLLQTLEGHEGAVNSVSFAVDGKTLASGSWDGTVKLWSVATRQLLANLKAYEGGVLSLTFSPDGKQLASGGWLEKSRLGEVKFWTAANEAIVSKQRNQ